MGLRIGYSMFAVLSSKIGFSRYSMFLSDVRENEQPVSMFLIHRTVIDVTHRVQEQENQKRQLCEELEQLKTPQDSREASCQTPVLEEEVREEVESGA